MPSWLLGIKTILSFLVVVTLLLKIAGEQGGESPGTLRLLIVKLYGYSDFAYQAISYGDVGLVGVNLLDPDGGEFAPSGGSYPITWEAPGDAYAFNLFYSLNNGTTWDLFATVPGSTYDWPVPVVPSNKKTCRVKIEEIDGGGSKVSEDRSSGPFTIEVVGSDFAQWR